MPIDTSIYGMVRQPAQQPGPLDEYAKAMTLRSMIDQQGLHALQRRKLEQEFADDDATRAAAIEARGDPVRMRHLPYGKGLYNPAPAMDKTIQDRTKGDAEILNHDRQLLGDVIKESNNDLKAIRTPEQYEAYRQRMMGTANMFSTPKMQEFVRQRAAQIPAQFDPQWVQRMLADGQKLVTPEIEVRNIGGQDVPYNKNPFAGPVGPWAGGVAMNRTVSPDAALSAGVQVRGQDQPVWDAGTSSFLTKPTAGAPVAPVGSAPAAPQASVPTSPLPGANATYKGANPMKATTDAIAKMKAEIAASTDPALRASLQREIDGAAAAIRMTPEQVAAIQPAVAQPSAYDTENLDARDLRLANMPNGGRPAAPAAPGGSVAIRPVDANGQPLPNPKAREDADNLRKEFEAKKSVKDLRDVIPLAEQARKAPNSSQGDIALIYAVGKILDPGSVVREGEMNLVVKSGSPEERVAGFLNYLNGGGRLTPGARANLQKMLDGAVTERRAAYDAEKASFEGIVKRRGYAPEDVFVGLPQTGGAPAAPTATARTPTRDEIDAELRRRGIAK